MTKHTKKQQKKPKERKELTFKFPLCLVTFGSASTLLFQTFSPSIFFFFSIKRKEKKNKEK
jgi:hypothetical protein